jgi:hypothetical protein
MKKTKGIIYMYYGIGFVLVLVAIFFRKKMIETMSNDTMPESAAEACKKISSRAEEIEAHYGGATKLLQNMPFASLFNPNNYRSGDNTSSDMGRNIINSTMKQEDITKINNECKQIANSIQRNVLNIDLSKCKYCETNPCSVSMTNVKQENIDKVEQLCQLEVAIEILMQNKKSIDAQALAKTLQKAQDLLSGNNNSDKENCNIINSKMTSESYLEAISTCAQESIADQENVINASCAQDIGLANILQRNKADKLQDCIIGTTVDKTLIAEEEVKVKAAAESEQTTQGISMLASAGSSIVSCVCSLSVAFILL